MPILHDWKCELINRSRQLEQLAEINGYRPIFVYPNDGKYIGEWIKSRPDGFGAKFQRNHLIYDGQWKDGKRHGTGAIRKQLPNGYAMRIYIGQWKDDMKHGEGKKFFNNGTYFGQWQNDKRSGLGIMWYKSGAIYIGEWNQDVYNGAGVLFHKNGNRYEGFFKDGLKHGEGIFYHMKTGQIQKGMWQQGFCKTSIMFDEFRNQVVEPTFYTMTQNKLHDPDKLVRTLFRLYFPEIKIPIKPFHTISCSELVKKIKRRFLKLCH